MNWIHAHAGSTKLISLIAGSQADWLMDQTNVKISYRSNIYSSLEVQCYYSNSNTMQVLFSCKVAFKIMKNPVVTVYHFSLIIKYYKGTYY